MRFNYWGYCARTVENQKLREGQGKRIADLEERLRQERDENIKFREEMIKMVEDKIAISRELLKESW